MITWKWEVHRLKRMFFQSQKNLQILTSQRSYFEPSLWDGAKLLQEWKRSHFTNLQHSAEAAGGLSSRWWKTPWFHRWIIATNEDGSCSVATLWLARNLLNHQHVVLSWDVLGYIKAHLLDRELFPFLNHPKFFFPLPTSQHIPTPIPIPTTQPQPPGPPSPSARSTPAGWKAAGRSSVVSWASNFPLFPGSRWCARRASHGCHGIRAFSGERNAGEMLGKWRYIPEDRSRQIGQYRQSRSHKGTFLTMPKNIYLSDFYILLSDVCRIFLDV